MMGANNMYTDTFDRLKKIKLEYRSINNNIKFPLFKYINKKAYMRKAKQISIFIFNKYKNSISSANIIDFFCFLYETSNTDNPQLPGNLNLYITHFKLDDYCCRLWITVDKSHKIQITSYLTTPTMLVEYESIDTSNKSHINVLHASRINDTRITNILASWFCQYTNNYLLNNI